MTSGLKRRTLILGASLLGLIGCGAKGEPNNVELARHVTVETVATKQPAVSDAEGKYRQPFEIAALTDEIPDEQQAPPDKTLAGRATGPIRAAVEKLWPQIALTDESGKSIPFVVKIETSEGDIEITLRPDLAPNHVRNWLALIKTGFYDGLGFDRIVRETFVDAQGNKGKLELIRGGCPLGTGDPGVGHLGYFLKPEFTPSEKHEEGTVGFWRDNETTSAGCRFYIALTPAVTLDGEYTIVGKVTKGIDVAKKIAAMPVQNPNNDPDRERPQQPILFKKLTASPDRLEWKEPVAHLQDRETSR